MSFESVQLHCLCQPDRHFFVIGAKPPFSWSAPHFVLCSNGSSSAAENLLDFGFIDFSCGTTQAGNRPGWGGYCSLAKPRSSSSHRSALWEHRPHESLSLAAAWACCVDAFRLRKRP